MPKEKQKQAFRLPEETPDGELIIYDKQGDSHHISSEIPKDQKAQKKNRVIVENYLNRLFQERQKTSEIETIKIIDEWIETFSEILLIMDEKTCDN